MSDKVTPDVKDLNQDKSSSNAINEGDKQNEGVLSVILGTFKKGLNKICSVKVCYGPPSV